MLSLVIRGTRLVASTMMVTMVGCGLAESNEPKDDVTEDTPKPTALDELPECRTLEQLNTGAEEGALILSGHVRDPSGTPIVGAQINLEGAASAKRYTTFTGSYVFKVDQSSYRLVATDSDGCTLSPTSVALESLVKDQVQDFVANGSGCVTAHVDSVISNGSRQLTLSNDVSTATGITEWSSEEIALERLPEIWMQEGSCRLTIAGYPAIESAMIVETEGPDVLGNESYFTMVTTTAIAAERTIFGFGSQMSPDAPDALVDFVLAAGRNLTPEQLAELRKQPD